MMFSICPVLRCRSLVSVRSTRFPSPPLRTTPNPVAEAMIRPRKDSPKELSCRRRYRCRRAASIAASAYKPTTRNIKETLISWAQNAFQQCAGSAELNIAHRLNRIRSSNVFENRVTWFVGGSAIRRRCGVRAAFCDTHITSHGLRRSHALTSRIGFNSLGSKPGVAGGPGIRQHRICRLRLALASGISALPETWPSG